MSIYFITGILKSRRLRYTLSRHTLIFCYNAPPKLTDIGLSTFIANWTRNRLFVYFILSQKQRQPPWRSFRSHRKFNTGILLFRWIILSNTRVPLYPLSNMPKLLHLSPRQPKCLPSRALLEFALNDVCCRCRRNWSWFSEIGSRAGSNFGWHVR